MKQFITSACMLVFVLTAMQFMSSCNRIDAGCVGIKVYNYGDNRGVSNVTEVTGWVWYNPLSTSVKEFPTYMQHKEYNGEGDTLKVFAKGGSEFHIVPIINYSIKPDRVISIFKKYRLDLGSLETQFLKTSIYEAFRIVANQYTPDSLISSRQSFDERVYTHLNNMLVKEGFELGQFTYSMDYPKSLRDGINAKNNAIQIWLTKENEVKAEEAEARKKIAKAYGDSVSMVMNAHAEAESNRVRQVTLTPILMQQKWLETWDGHLPQYMMGSGTNMSFMMPLKP